MPHSPHLRFEALANRSRKRTRVVCATVLSLVAAACDDPPTEPPARVADPITAQVGVPTSPPMLGEQHFHRLAHEIPEFGGHFLDSAGNLIAYVTESTKADAVRAALQAELGAARRSTHSEATVSLRIEIRLARFSFLQLAGWRDALSSQGFARIAGMHFIDLQETENRIVIAVTDAGEAAAVRSLAAVSS